ncbi:MAG TPA: WYL domain-containing protein [Blastocatellia bacterium]|nr:WYL domain-containing protein [Blastocatellia bacterium]
MNEHSDKGGREHYRHLVRVFWIDAQMRSLRYPNAATIAAHFEVSEKTARRTLEFMREQMKMPIAYAAAHRGWYYTEPGYALPMVDLTEGDLVAILLAEKLSRQYRGTALGRQVGRAFEKVLKAMTSVVSVDFRALAEAWSFEAAATSELEPEIFRQLGQAVQQRRQVEMLYYTASSGELKWRRVNPLHLRNYLGEWYLVAHDHLRGAPRVFLASRIRELTLTEEHFDPPPGFNLGEYLGSSFGMIIGSEPQEVEIVFDEYQARWIRERSKFHPTEDREEMPDGRLKLKMTVTALDGVKRFVMQYGAHAEVTRPEELRQAIREEVEAMQTIYGDRQTDNQEEK